MNAAGRDFRALSRIAALLLIDTRPNAETPEGRASRYESAAHIEREGPRIVADSMRGRLFAPSTSSAVQEEWFARIGVQPRVGAAACARAAG